MENIIGMYENNSIIFIIACLVGVLFYIGFHTIAIMKKEKEYVVNATVILFIIGVVLWSILLNDY